MAKIKIYDNSEILAGDAARSFLELAEKIIVQKNYLNIALSGGSTPKILFKILLDKFTGKIDWSKINVYWVDERCVPPDSSESNFGEAFRILFKNISGATNLFRMKGEDDPAIEAERYGDLLKQNLHGQNGFPVLDLIFLGMGEDGHTASIFPGQLDLFTKDKVCSESVNPAGGQKRLTLTGKVLNNASNIYFMVTGKNKSSVIKDVFEKSKKSSEYPVSHIKNDNSVIWFLDKEASSLL